MRFFNPKEGTIYIDGIDLAGLDLKSYRGRVSVVMQDDYLFSGTIKDNIEYGSFGAEFDLIQKAAKKAQADAFIREKEGEYLFQVGDRGMHLSRGQRQRIAIARALLRDPSMLILDEAMSSLDAITENLIQQSIRDDFKSRTVFIVAHRFSTIMGADKIIVLEGGHIVAMGTHENLLKQQGIYRELYLEQFLEEDVLQKK